MRILVLTPEIPATSSMPGSPRLFNLCRFLSRSHSISLITGSQIKGRRQMFAEDPSVSGVFESVTYLPEEPAPTWWNKQKQRLRVAPYFITEFWKPEYYRGVLDIVRRELQGHPPVDLIYVDCLMMAQYAKPFRGMPIVADIHDSLTLLQRRLLNGERRLSNKLKLDLALRGIQKLESSLHSFCNLVITNSSVDEAVIKELSPAGATLTITNGVDMDYFATTVDEPAAGHKLVFTGVMGYGPNEDAALYFGREIFPLVRADVPEAEFWVVGANPSIAVLDLAAQPGIHVTGSVDDVRPYLATADVFVCPLRYGAGIKNKLLAAMAMGKAIVATPLSLEGIDARPEEEVLVADGVQDFGRQIARLLSDKELSRRLGTAGRKLVRERYSWNARGKELESRLRRIVTEHPS
jgi:glycosyltransferase involved in cell wall biosynthesis